MELWRVLTSYGTSQEQASWANLPVFIGKRSLHVSIAREVDGRERNVPQKACFGTLSVGKGRKTTWNTYPIEKIKLLWNLSWNKIFPEETELYSQVKRVTEKKKSIAQILQVINLNFLFKNRTNFIEEEGVVLALANSKISIQVIWGLGDILSLLMTGHWHFKEVLFSEYGQQQPRCRFVHIPGSRTIR